ncbi:MAG: M14 family zinc carboxypeptidase [Christensenellales bacterium]
MKVVRMGDHGPTVSYLHWLFPGQDFARENDGLFGPETRRALTAFQVSRRLIVDGVAGPLTWQALLPFLRGYIHHIVHGGDTLYQLSRLYNTTVFAILTANPGLEPALLIPGQRITVPFGFPVVPSQVPYSSQLVSLIIDGLTARYPQIRTQTIGQSILGQPLHTLTFGTGDTSVFFNASHHANEWITTPVVLTFLEQVCQCCCQRQHPIRSAKRRPLPGCYADHRTAGQSRWGRSCDRLLR